MTKTKAMTIQDFFGQFPDDDACLDHLFRTRFGDEPVCPKCGQVGKFGRLANMPAYTCNCGHHLHPMVDTPFERSRTPLQKWFYAMFLFTTTRNGVAAKELQRQLGVTYKTAWRMAKLIREYMGYVDGEGTLGGRGQAVEVDETFIGGKDKRGHEDKTVVLGMIERRGEVVTRVVPNRYAKTLVPIIRQCIAEGTRVMTDDWSTYRGLRNWGFFHESVNHSAKEYVRGDAHTNNIEAFWSGVKRMVKGTHIWVSPKHLPTYLGEAEFRYNLRNQPQMMFPLLLSAFQRP
ncbi:IS1595 family transposase [Hyphobacterium sp.]|uniref:IS1595 family transposase n=1 Tax=Hyphobacterium sp. TaxID=2004662 RepID=UPI00374A50A1